MKNKLTYDAGYTVKLNDLFPGTGKMLFNAGNPMNLNQAIAFHLAELHTLGYVPQCNWQQHQTQSQVTTNAPNPNPVPIPIPGLSILFLFSVAIVISISIKPWSKL